MRTSKLIAALAAVVIAQVALSSAAAQPSSHGEHALAAVWNGAACGLTDTAVLDLAAPARLTRVDLWYHWNPGESSVGYRLGANGRIVAGGTLQRAECDAYQGSWCVARDTPNLQLTAGRYQIRTARAGVCQNAGSGGSGFIKAFGVTLRTTTTVPNNPVPNNPTPTKPPVGDCGCKADDEMCLVLCRHNPGQPPSHR